MFLKIDKLIEMVGTIIQMKAPVREIRWADFMTGTVMHNMLQNS